MLVLADPNTYLKRWRRASYYITVGLYSTEGSILQLEHMQQLGSVGIEPTKRRQCCFIQLKCRLNSPFNFSLKIFCPRTFFDEVVLINLRPQLKAFTSGGRKRARCSLNARA